MATYATPLSDGRTSPQGFHRILGKIFTSSGVIEADALEVSAQVSPDMTVIISGSATDDNAVFIHSDGHFIQAWNAADLTDFVIPANTSGSSKTDAIVAYVDLEEGNEDNANNPGALKFKAVRGASGAPSDGEITADADVGSNPFIVLAHVVVANGASSINSGNITDQREMAHIDGGLVEPGSLTTDAYGAGSISSDKLSTDQGQIAGEWQDWSPTISAGGSMTVSSLSIIRARYIQIGKVVHFSLVASFTLGGTPHTDIRFTIPVAIKNPTATWPFIGFTQTTTPDAGFGYWSATGIGIVRRPESANWTTGTTRQIYVSGTYEAA